MSLDKFLEKEFREAAKTTKKKYGVIKAYFYEALRHCEIKSLAYTEFEDKQYTKMSTDAALSYTRDYIWFDEKNLKKRQK